MTSKVGFQREEMFSDGCREGCNGRTHLFRLQPLRAIGPGLIKHTSSDTWGACVAELRETTVVFFELDSYKATGHTEDSDIMAIISVHRCRVDFVHRDEVFRIYFSPTSADYTVHAFVEPGKDQVGDWRSGLAHAKATKIIGPGDLRVHSRIGEGGYGKVYVVSFKRSHHMSNVTSEYSDSTELSSGDYRNVEDGDVLAMKVIPKTAALNSCTALRHLAYERMTLERAREHPYLMHLSFSFQTSDYLFMGMPLCPGGDLVSYVNRMRPRPFRFPRWHRRCCGTYFHRPRLDEDSARRIAAQMIVALETLHSWGVLYRDIKAENVFIDADGNILLGDFGLARSLVDSHSREYQPGAVETSMDDMTICGTEPCMAPEVFTGKYSYESDVWSLGITMFRLLTGRHPFQGQEGLPSKPTLSRKQPELKFPCFVSRKARRFLRKILVNDPEKRADLKSLQKHSFFRRIDWLAVKEKRLVALPNIPGMLKTRGHSAGIKVAITREEWKALNRKHVAKEDCWKSKESSPSDHQTIPGFEYGFSIGRYKKLPLIEKSGVAGGGWYRGWRGVEDLPDEVKSFLFL